MSTEQAHIDSAEQLFLIGKKRNALEKLVAIARSISDQGGAISDLLLLTRPSQKIPEKVRKRLSSLLSSLEKQDDAQLKEKLEHSDTTVKSASTKLISLTEKLKKLDPNDSNVTRHIDLIQKLVEAFNKQLSVCIALRCMLQSRGVTTERLILAFNQEHLSEQLDDIREEENQCRDAIKTRLREISHDCAKLLSSTKLPSSMREELEQVKSSMDENLKHLESGKDIRELSINLEVIDVDTPERASGESFGTSPGAQSKQPAGDRIEQKVKRSSDQNAKSRKASNHSVRKHEQPSDIRPEKSIWQRLIALFKGR